MDRATREALRSFPRAMWVLAAGNFVNRAGGFVIPMMTLHLAGLGYDEHTIAIVLSAYGVGKIGASFAGAVGTERFGHRTVVVASMFSSAAVMMGMAGLTDFAALVIANLLLGFTSELFRPATSTLIADLVSPENRIVAFALNRLAINAGFSVGPAVAGFIAERSFFWVFAGNAIAASLYGLIAWRGLPGRASPLSGHGGGPGRIDRTDATWGEVMRDRRLVWFLLSILPVTFVFMQPSASMALYTHEAGMSARDFGLLLSINGVLIVCGEMSLTSVTRRYSPAAVLMLGYVMLGGGFALTGACTTFWPLAATVCVWTLGEMISAPAQGATMANLATDRLRSRYMAAYSLMWSIGTIFGPQIGMSLYAWDPAALWAGSAASGIASALLVRIALRREPAQAVTA